MDHWVPGIMAGVEQLPETINTTTVFKLKNFSDSSYKELADLTLGLFYDMHLETKIIKFGSQHK